MSNAGSPSDAQLLAMAEAVADGIERVSRFMKELAALDDMARGAAYINERGV